MSIQLIILTMTARYRIYYIYNTFYVTYIHGNAICSYSNRRQVNILTIRYVVYCHPRNGIHFRNAIIGRAYKDQF